MYTLEIVQQTFETLEAIRKLVKENPDLFPFDQEIAIHFGVTRYIDVIGISKFTINPVLDSD